MHLFAIGDLHLPGGDDKPMNVFGPHWDGHFERICQDWRSRVQAEDVVLLPGDLTWAMQLKEAIPDLQAIGALPGQKLMVKGNHDYWWSSLTQVRANLPESMTAIQHNAVVAGNWVICGTRGWTIPTKDTPLTPEDERIYKRELIRMELALQEAQKKGEGRDVIVMLHYPPLYDLERDTAFTALMEQYGVKAAVYGHLHGAGIRVGFTGEHHGVSYHLTSCDSLDFRLASIL